MFVLLIDRLFLYATVQLAACACFFERNKIKRKGGENEGAYAFSWMDNVRIIDPRLMYTKLGSYPVIRQ
jgi:hypothetical protein